MQTLEEKIEDVKAETAKMNGEVEQVYKDREGNARCDVLIPNPKTGKLCRFLITIWLDGTFFRAMMCQDVKR